MKESFNWGAEKTLSLDNSLFVACYSFNFSNWNVSRNKWKQYLDESVPTTPQLLILNNVISYSWIIINVNFWLYFGRTYVSLLLPHCVSKRNLSSYEQVMSFYPISKILSFLIFCDYTRFSYPHAYVRCPVFYSSFLFNMRAYITPYITCTSDELSTTIVCDRLWCNRPTVVH